MADARFLNPLTILSKVGGIAIDITQRVNENYEHIITQNPVEDGSPTTDHVTNLPPKITIQGGFSDLSITNLVGPAFDLTKAIKGRAKTEFDRLLDLFAERETFEVMDGFHLFKDMQFKSLQLMKEREGFSIFFQAEIWNIRKISTATNPRANITSIIDSLNRLEVTPQLMLSVGAVTTKDSLQSIGVLA